MIAGKHLDPLVGVDVHIVQPPGPVPPVPIPHPYVGILFDPMDYVPILGATVKINGLPRAVAGTSGQAMPPHIPMGGVFVKPPTSESEVFMGSMTVSADGDPLSRLAMPVLSCQDIGMPAPPRKRKKKKSVSLMLPTTLLMAIPVGPMVMVGGPPIIAMPGPMDALGPLAKGMVKLRKALAKKSKRFARAMRAMSNTAHKKAKKVMDRVGLGDKARNRIHRAICTVTGHPVDVATGKLFTEQVDFEVPGPIPFRWERVWYSTSRQRGALGLGWHHAYDLALIETDGAVAVRLADGRVCAFPALADGQSYFDPAEKLTLEKQGQMYRLRGKDGLGWVFSAQPRSGDPFVLTAIQDRSGNQIRFHYVLGRLDHLVDSAGRRISFLWDDADRILSITGPTDTDEHARMTLVAYAYDRDGCLIQAADALGKSTYYTYQNGLLVRETNRNGLSFYFQYDGSDERAHCIRTWGDGGIYDHKITYDDLIGKTVVVNSLGHQTTYQHRGGLVFKTIDALGAVHLVERDDTHNVISETDPMGGMTMTTYDDRGNVTSVMGPGGAKTSMTYNEQDLLVSAVDAMGGQWRWAYDELGRVVARQDPLGRTTQYQWQGRNLGMVVDAAGQPTWLTWNERGDLVLLRTADLADSQWRFDLLGRCTAAIDPQGNEQRREFDRMGRALKVYEPDGNVRELVYDAGGNVIRARDSQHDVQFAYGGMNRLIARSEGGTMVQFAYDTEEQLVGIRNEHGLVYQFVLGPTGEVERELGWDGLMRRYQRDKAGRVTKVMRGTDEDGRWSAYKHDAAGRVVQVKHADESQEGYAYRPDGLLSVATNGTSAVVFERDVIGRIIKESQGEHSIVSRWDVRDLRDGFVSSLGADVRITRNVMGDVTGVEAAGGPQVTGAGKQGGGPGAGLGAGAEAPVGARTPESLFSARFARDRLGLEVERALPGGVLAKWQRDRLGRPLRHEIWSPEHGRVRDSHYTWGHNDRLQAVVDSLRGGPVQYAHDAVGNLSAAKYEDGRIDLRMPDAVGNLFRVSTRTDRVYGPAGQLLEANDGRTGITRYAYDVEGNLLSKTEPNGGVWRYTWNAAGMLVKVLRPDGAEVGFAYDALGRRSWKKYRGKTTRWVWDGNVPLHEWVERDNAAIAEVNLAVPTSQASAIDAQIARRNAEVAVRRAQGPPRASGAVENKPLSEGTKAEPITWLFEPESFAPLARLAGKERHSIITDHLGTPVSMHDAKGRAVWSADVGAWGQLRRLQGDRAAQPFRWPGQYEDIETGLYYNRFRYYDPDAGQYVSQDPIGLAGGLGLHAYVGDPNDAVDPLGLANECAAKRQQRMLEKNVGYNISPESWFQKYSHIGRGGTFVTDKKAFRDIVGHARPGKYSVGGKSGKNQVSRVQARKLENKLGLDRGSLKDGFRISRVEDIGSRSPRSPLEGNAFFRGPGEGLPGGGPEIVIDSIATQ